jgi:uncharacterized protein
MQDDAFDWDDDKARTNLTKHRIDFWEATLVFEDVGAVDEPDGTMDYGEERFKVTGMANGRLVTVLYTERDERIRIFSARRPTRQEQRDYARQNPQS